MKGMSARRAGLSIVAVTLLTGVVACSSEGPGRTGGDEESSSSVDGGGGTRVSPIAALRIAEKSTGGADSAKVESTTTMGSLMAMTADGSLAWGSGLTGTLTITYTGGTMADTMRQMGTTSMEARYLPDAYYARMGDAFAEQAGGKHWIKYPYEALKTLGGGSGAYLKDQMENSTPNQSVKLLLASGDVRRVGEEKVRGERTTHYSGTVDVADLATRNSSLGESQLADLKKQLEQAGVTTETVDIWVDDDDLLVKKVEKGQSTNGEYSQTAYYSDYGTPADTEAPPSSDTADFSELLQRQGTGSTS
ncbi:hypothetical protein ABZY42_06360 [Streptomyces sp. NPDC006622]|uniref:hypothetical protein n=1 Tax=Streptomyces sp. NPDC006622 TaxID=3155459 RepID=UPI0033B08B0E